MSAKKLMTELAAFVGGDDGDDGDAKKKPAASTSMKRPAAALAFRGGSLKKRPASAASVQEGAGNPAEEDTRDRMADYYFKRAVDNGDLSPDMATMWAELVQSGNRKSQTKMINGLMQKKDGSGKWVLDMTTPTATEIREKFRTRYVKDEKVGVPKGIAKVKFGGTEASLQEAIDTGDCMTTEVDGKTFYSWREIRCGEKSGSSARHKVSTNTAITAEAFAKASKMLDSLQWSFKYTVAENKAAEEGEGLPEHIVSKIALAKSAVEKVMKITTDVVVKLKPLKSKTAVFATTYATSVANLSDLRTQVGLMENLKVLGTNSEGKQANCQQVLNMLASAAITMEKSYKDSQAAQSLINSDKRS